MPLCIASCGDSGQAASADPTPPPVASPVEDAINRACGEDNLIDVAMATKKVGYGSRTDYWLVVCQKTAGPTISSRYVVRVGV